MKYHDSFNCFLDRKSFLRYLATMYNIEESILLAISKDYEILPRGEYFPDLDEEFAGDIHDIAKMTEFNYKLILLFVDSNILTTPFKYRDVYFLKHYRNVFEKIIDKINRELTYHPELDKKWKRWVYKYYLNNSIAYDAEGRMLNPQNRIRVDVLAKEVSSKLGIDNTPELRKEIYKIREIAYNDRKKSREKDIPIADVAAQRQAQFELRLHFGLL